MKKILIVPALAALAVVAACTKTETSNTTNEVTVNETVAEEAAPIDTNSAVDLNTTGNEADVVAADNAADNATGNVSNGL